MPNRSHRSLSARVGVVTVFVALAAMACTDRTPDSGTLITETTEVSSAIDPVAQGRSAAHHHRAEASIESGPSPNEAEDDASDSGGGSGSSTSTATPGSTSTGSQSGLHSDVANSTTDLLSGSSGWSDVRIGSSDEPLDSHQGPFPNVGTFRVFCHLSHQNFDDAIVFPGVVDATHLHSYFGNTRTNAHSTADTLLTSGNSTCSGGTADRSAYWVPSVYDSSTGTLVRPSFAAVYYQSGFGGGIDPESIQPIPRGLKMLAGSAAATPSDPTSDGYWGCFDNGPPTNTGETIPDCPSGHQITMIVNFPQCWDGANLDSSDHKSHMRYPSYRSGCPSGFVPIPRIMLQVIYPQESHGTSGWVLSSDMYSTTEPGGASIHADFFNGWDEAIMARWLNNCVRAVRDCERGELGGGEALTFEWRGWRG
jgi:Domain of unknown function (DUF1996)